MARSETETQTTFLPDLCGVRALFGVVILSELVAVILTVASGGTAPGFLYRLSLMSLFVQWSGLSAAAALCLSRRWMSRLPETAVAVVSYLMILFVVYCVSEIAWWFLNPTTGADPLIELKRMDFLARTLVVSAIVAALTLRYFYVQHHWKRRTVSEAEARLDALQARIRPHFLFNCMNTIASLTRTDPERAERAIEDLSDLFRASMSEARTLVSCAEEFALVRGYLNIESLRLGDRLKTDWQIDDFPDDIHIPLLTLQPLVENAIYHGIEPLPEGGVITIAARSNGQIATIEIINPHAESSDSHHQGNRLAQENVRQRIGAYFGDSGGLSIDNDASTVSRHRNNPSAMARCEF